MRWVFWVGVWLWPCLAHGAVTAADVSREVREISLDPGECYRVRDVALPKDEARFFLTDGYLIFAKPVAGVRMAAVFTADVEGGDAEVPVSYTHLDVYKRQYRARIPTRRCQAPIQPCWCPIGSP